MRKWRWIDHTLRKGVNLLENKRWTEIHTEPEGKEDLRKPGKGPFWRKHENAVKHEASLRSWRATARWK
jgi:hypothetical protein